VTAPTTRTTFLRLTQMETLLALPSSGRVHIPVPDPAGGPRAVLERLLLDALTTSPCYVLFSGGRDSSALLALATLLARREGLPLPVPVTVRFPEVRESDETYWQDLVMEHLRLPEHVVFRFHDEENLLGEVATSAIRRHGVVWPEAVQLHGARYRHLDPGVIISGEGGDMVLTGHRMAALRAVAARQRPRRRILRYGLEAARPAFVVRAAARRMVTQAVAPWLRPALAEEFIARVVEMSAEPLRWDTATRSAIRMHHIELLTANFNAAILEYGSCPVNPFLDPEFVEALARAGGPFGWGDRTEVFRRLFADVLPDAVLARPTKAGFNGTRWGPREREFARTWDGAGFDDALIDVEQLRAGWLREDPHPSADFLLHVAWAHSQGIPVETAP